MNSEKAINNILKSELEITFKTLKIISQDKQNPKKYIANGKITQDKNGQLILEAIWSPPKGKPLEPNWGMDYIEPGQIIPKEHYFKIEGISVEGHKWIATDIHLSTNYYFPTSTIVFKGQIPDIFQKGKTAHPPTGNTRLIACEVKDLKIPTNEYNEKEQKRNITNVTVADKKCQIRIHENHVTFLIKSPKQITNEKAQSIVHAIELATGKNLQKIYDHSITPKSFSITLYSRPAPEELWSILPPLNRHHKIDELEEITNKLHKLSQEKRKAIIWFWKEIGISSQAGIEPFMKSICSNIEGMVDFFYSKYKVADSSFEKECLQALDVISKIESSISPRAFQRISGNLKSAGSPSVKNAFYKLLGNKADNWNSLRHKALHGSHQKLFNDTQKLFDLTYSCLYIFYELTLEAIGHRNKIIDYSTRGYPEIPPLISQIKAGLQSQK
ncbi:hypothetical protein [Aquipseudomonas alcaligenes]|uniref:ApeA N-terminal domain-containing protein n=1 Tax=Aquipseudomonas alcaligenes (strain ATCC 14909 / DSM 50342 / CCUG 1425 / JCM 20561 / NBRC 14159 / NCIMB 9945 / NCTC 10367 / 1577) TaxID=1215092 RepID=U3B2K1_AQUA1|nr:hypothetical protein [Pseudomonas alcaligenes]GAD64084.1 hypothetical protein PA6_033_00100 [Pseudomonas alcaligenes NBRC 14159]SUD18892.1 Uncharacterised protein [Pseudomonas alcaligenes]